MPPLERASKSSICCYPEEQVIRPLIDHSRQTTFPSDINIPDNEGNTPLHLASEKSKQEVVKHLLINGADGNLRNHKQWAPIHVATLHNNGDVIKASCLWMI